MQQGNVEKLLANTYDTAPSGWERVKEYNEVIDYSTANPSTGSSAIANALELPRGRIRPWLDGTSRPEPVKAIQVANAKDWLEFDWTTAPTPQINALVAWLYAGGGIDSQYVPHFTVDDEKAATLLDHGMEAIDANYERRHEADNHRATEIVPSDTGAIFGRLLVALGLPQGEKGRNASISLPEYLNEAPAHIRADFARTYVFVRGSENPGRPKWPIQLREDRSARFTRSLKKLIRNVLEDPQAVTGADDAATIYISDTATEQLHQPPKALANF